MNRLFSAKVLVAATVALGAVAAASAAHARTDVVLSIGLNSPYGYVQPAPVYAPEPVYVQPQSVYVQPQSVYVQPRPVYVQPRSVYVQPRPIYAQPQVVYYGNERRYERGGPFGDWDRDGIQNRFDRDSRFYEHRARGHRGWGDWDRDGVPNRWDQAPNNPYRR